MGRLNDNLNRVTTKETLANAQQRATELHLQLNAERIRALTAEKNTKYLSSRPSALNIPKESVLANISEARAREILALALDKGADRMCSRAFYHLVRNTLNMSSPELKKAGINDENPESEPNENLDAGIKYER